MESVQSMQNFLNLIKRSQRGKFKIYIGMVAGVGKTYRMLQEAHQLKLSGVDVQIGYIETHGRAETHALIEGISQIHRRKIFYKGKELEEMDLDAILRIRPEIVIVDELAHTNVEGSKNEKRWQDVLDILDAGINVISAMNIQHIESLNQEVESITGIEIRERIPDSVLLEADEVINIDLASSELIKRLQDGKIYSSDKIDTALTNFFKSDNILQLRELALKEVALCVEKKVEQQMSQNIGIRHERFLACISSSDKTPRRIIRKVARLSTHYNSKFFVLYVRTASETADKIPLARQRYLINSFKLASDLGAEVIQLEAPTVIEGIIEACKRKQISTVCIGKPKFKLFTIIGSAFRFRYLFNTLAKSHIDIIILS